MFRINQALGAKANRHPHMMQTKKWSVNITAYMQTHTLAQWHDALAMGCCWRQKSARHDLKQPVHFGAHTRMRGNDCAHMYIHSYTCEHDCAHM
jgi:hypothetical protein